ncbi:MAG: hypothetical protein M1817_001549 [Caeruleum heppii]|nr:MAG: hypothetical protein M1817_001549 [Caeruleum heppii]
MSPLQHYSGEGRRSIEDQEPHSTGASQPHRQSQHPSLLTNHNVGRGRRPNDAALTSSDPRRKPVPSPLQSSYSHISDTAVIDEEDDHDGFSAPYPSYLTSSRPSTEKPQLRPRGTRTPSDQDHPRSPQDRLDALLASSSSSYSLDQHRKTSASSGTSDFDPTAAESAKASSYGQLRNVSAPALSNRPSGPPLSTSSSSAMNSAATQHRPDMRPMVRTSSIDSAISSISSQASLSHKSSQDSNTNPADVANLIAAAGSPEAVIQYLLKEKRSSASQNAQLWRLVDKQRLMILGLNKDLERALRDKERHRKKLKDHIAHTPRLPSEVADALKPDALRIDHSSPATSRENSDLTLKANNVHDIVADGLRGDALDATSIDAAADPGLSQPRPSEDTSSVDQEAVVSIQVPTMPESASSSTANSALSNDKGEVGHPETASQDPRVKPRPIETTGPLKAMNRDSRASEEGSEAPSPRSFGASRAKPKLQVLGPPSFALIEPSPIVENAERPAFPQRKAPPAPLNLGKPNRASTHLHQADPDHHSDSDYDDILEVDEIPAFERGRRKTREEDDREREIAAQRQAETRSRSKKEKSLKSPSQKGEVDDQLVPEALSVPLPLSPQTKQAVPISPPAAAAGFLSPAGSLASVLSNNASDVSSNIAQRMTSVSPPPVSPGLPVSPRPTDRPMNSPVPRLPKEGSSVSSSLASPPLSPRSGMPGLPLSPRAPKHAIPLPPGTPMSLASPSGPRPDARNTSPPQPAPAVIEAPHQAPERRAEDRREPMDHLGSTASRTIYRGLMSDQYPDLLLPPDALPSVHVRVVSSRLRPSRASFLPGRTRPAEEDAVFTLGVFARWDGSELWKVEKDLMSLPMLDRQLKKGSDCPAKLPERGLFSGHAPARIDARRAALDQYFETVMDTPFTQPLALVLCQFLSTDAVDPDAAEPSVAANGSTTLAMNANGPDVRPRKDGYLTKRGKNFGGWKARFFCLDGPVLRYYECPGGPHLGVIKLQNAQIGKQTHHQSSPSPSRRGGDDLDHQYRHAFLILEPKKKDSTSLVRHVLCAESDSERDEWVTALLYYVEDKNAEDEQASPTGTASGSTPQSRNGSGSKAVAKDRESPEVDEANHLRAVNYEDTVQAEAPREALGSNRRQDTPSPPVPSAKASQASLPNIAQCHGSKTISRPTNGAVIHNAGAWGNKPPPLNLTEKKEKKRSIWGFKGRSSSDSNVHGHISSGLHQQQSVEVMRPVRAVFGISLTEAAEHCGPRGVDVYLPAVVYRCIEYLDAKQAASEEGIFRLSGSNVLIKSLRERFNVEGDVNLVDSEQYYDVHAIASLLKLYLRELPSTVLTRELHLDFLHVIELESKNEKVATLKALVRRLPRANASLLRALSAFLITIVDNSDINKMTVRNVGIVISPTLNIPAPVLAMLLTDFETIFGSNPDDHSPSSPTAVEVTVSAPQPSSDDIRSPRRQLFQDLPTPAYNQTSFASPNPSSRNVQAPLAPAAHLSNDTGFIPLQPSYEQPAGSRLSAYQQAYQQQSHHNPPVTMAGPEYGSLNGALAPPNARDPRQSRLDHTIPGPEYNAHGRSLTPGDSADTKARRRESSLLGMGLPMGMAQRKSSLPQLREHMG